MLTFAEPMIAPESLEGKDLSAPYDLDRALVKAAQEMNIDWPEFPQSFALVLLHSSEFGFAKRAWRWC